MHVYFDHNATTAPDERVLEAMLPFLKGEYGNASSRHEFGTRARKAVNRAREQVARLVNVQASQVVFVSGGTEANNLFIEGAAVILKIVNGSTGEQGAGGSPKAKLGFSGRTVKPVKKE